MRETVPESVDRALASALAQSPADRFPTATQFAEALSQSATTAPVVVGARGGRKRAWVAGVGALLALTLLGGWLFARSRRSPVAPSASVIAVLPFLPSTADTALARLGRDLVLTISANLDGVGGIRAADPRLVLARADDSKRDRGTADAIALGKNLGAGSVVVGGYRARRPRRSARPEAAVDQRRFPAAGAGLDHQRARFHRRAHRFRHLGAAASGLAPG